MSLISVRNLVSPLTNKGNLIAIIVVVFAFGMYRASGGAVRVESRDSRGGYSQGSGRSVQERPANTFRDTSDLDLIEETIPAKPARQAEPVKPAPQQEAPPSDGLRDIEESLGLR